MARMTNVDREFEMAKSRFVREYNNEINYLKNELNKANMKVKRLEDILVKDGRRVEDEQV